MGRCLLGLTLTSGNLQVACRLCGSIHQEILHHALQAVGRSLQRSQVLAGQRVFGTLEARLAVMTVDCKQLAEKCVVIVEPLQQFVDVPLRVE